MPARKTSYISVQQTLTYLSSSVLNDNNQQWGSSKLKFMHIYTNAAPAAPAIAG